MITIAFVRGNTKAEMADRLEEVVKELRHPFHPSWLGPIESNGMSDSAGNISSLFTASDINVPVLWMAEIAMAEIVIPEEQKELLKKERLS